jgi:hypothetical protein
MISTPLGLVKGKLHQEIKLNQVGSFLWRGYVGSWEIAENGRLYLNRIVATLHDPERPVTLEDFFPGFAEKIFAHWVTKTLHCKFDLDLSEASSTPQRDSQFNLYLKLVRGVLIDKWVEKDIPGEEF